MAKFHVSFRDLSDSIIVSAADVQTDAFGSYVFLDEGERVAVLPVEVVKSILEEEHRQFPAPPTPFVTPEDDPIDEDGAEPGSDPDPADVGLPEPQSEDPDPPAEDQGAKIG